MAQFVRIQPRGIVDKINYLRKHLQTKFMCYNKNIKTLFILNDIKSAKALNDQFNTSIFKSLNDPIMVIETDGSELDIKTEYGINNDRKVYLHFGALAERKGTIDLLDAIAHISQETQNKICLVLAGKPDGSIKELLEEKINYYQQNSSVQIIYIGSFIENKRMKALFDASDFVLIPYKNPESSSGILGHAAVAGKPVIGNANGLLGELIETYHLGYTLNEISPLSLGKAISDSHDKLYETHSEKYLQTNSAEGFSNAIFNSLEI